MLRGHGDCEETMKEITRMMIGKETAEVIKETERLNFMLTRIKEGQKNK